VRGAEITANAFRMLGATPLLGRTLTEQDERAAEPPVIVIGHTVWKTRFASDPRVLGQTVKLGTATATIVGVMPEGFGFPVSQRVWTPLRVDGSTLPPRTGPAVSIFGRLADGASMDDARAELGVIGARLTASSPQTHEHLRPRVTTYAKPLAEGPQAAMIRNVLYIANGIFLMLLLVVCANVATLVFARTATRGWEITVRTALGASRGRIVTQLFIEALVLAGVGATLGLLAARMSLRWGAAMLGSSDGMPYWLDDGMSWKTVLYAALLTLVAAAIVGILPALRVTKINVQDALRSESAARSGLRFGGISTAMIIVQIAITVAFLPLAAGGVFESNRFRQRAEGIGAERFLTASVDMDREDHGPDSAAFAARARRGFDELERRLAEEPGVERVTFADRLPVMDQFKYQIEVDPTIRLTDVQPLTNVGGGEATSNWALTAVASLVGFIVLLLSATGIHALMSFTVARRTREIGIRAALGASQGRIVAGIFSRAFLQISAGVLVGSGLAALVGLGSMRQILLLLAADGLMLLVGLAACAVPLQRALRIDPTEALRAEG
jgi:putative ABC transport system permease protein